jgi:hypothetical protein
MLPVKADENQKQKGLSKDSKSDIVSLIKGNHVFLAKLSDGLPKDILKTQDLPRVKEIADDAGEANVRKYIEYELIRLQSLVSVSGNLNDFQVQFVASQLFKDHPNESIGDFRQCFDMGAMGKFGEIYRMDGVVIGEWMRKYLEVKYQAIEEDLYRHKDNHYKVYPQSIPKAGTDEAPVENIAPPDVADRILKEWEDKIKNAPDVVKSVKALTPDEIKKEGREIAPKKPSYPTTSASEIRERDIHLAYIKANYDARTGKPLDGWMEESEWRKLNNL